MAFYNEKVKKLVEGKFKYWETYQTFNDETNFLIAALEIRYR